MAAAMLKISEQNQNPFTTSMGRNENFSIYIRIMGTHRLRKSDFADQVRSVALWP